MVRSAATTVEGYLAELPAERRETIAAVRDAIARGMPPGYEEAIAWGMIAWSVPLSRYPVTYNKQPLLYVALAAQKNHESLYLPCVYASPLLEGRLQAAFAEAGKKLDKGKGCVRFRKAGDLPLEAIGDIIASTAVDTFIAQYEASRAR